MTKNTPIQATNDTMDSRGLISALKQLTSNKLTKADKFQLEAAIRAAAKQLGIQTDILNTFYRSK